MIKLQTAGANHHEQTQLVLDLGLDVLVRSLRLPHCHGSAQVSTRRGLAFWAL